MLMASLTRWHASWCCDSIARWINPSIGMWRCVRLFFIISPLEISRVCGQHHPAVPWNDARYLLSARFPEKRLRSHLFSLLPNFCYCSRRPRLPFYYGGVAFASCIWLWRRDIYGNRPFIYPRYTDRARIFGMHPKSFFTFNGFLFMWSEDIPKSASLEKAIPGPLPTSMLITGFDFFHIRCVRSATMKRGIDWVCFALLKLYFAERRVEAASSSRGGI